MGNLKNFYALASLLATVALGCASTSPEATGFPETIVNPVIIRSEGIQPKQLKREALQVPEALFGQTASVAADVHVSAYGEVVQTVRIRGNPVLHDALSEAARSWRFAPFIVERESRAFVLPLRVDLSWANGSATIKMRIRESE